MKLPKSQKNLVPFLFSLLLRRKSSDLRWLFLKKYKHVFRTSELNIGIYMLTRSFRGLSPILTITTLTTVAHAMSCLPPPQDTTLVSLSHGKRYRDQIERYLGDQTWTYFGNSKTRMRSVSRTSFCSIETETCSRQTRYSDYRYRKSACVSIDSLLNGKLTLSFVFYFPGKRKHSRRN